MSCKIPYGSTTVDISIISPNRVYDVPPDAFLTPKIPGTTYSDTPCLSFLIEHRDRDGKLSRLMFDLGIRRDWENSPPAVFKAVKSMGIRMEDRPDVVDCLAAHNVPLDSINDIIFSHWHFDHIGDATRFPTSCSIIVGPGFRENLLPGYPTNPNSLINENAFKHRELKQLDFQKSNLEIAGLAAIDWFQDGSFYILNTPGHAIGHISALARTTLGTSTPTTSDTFVLLAGDICHHAGELRPSASQPLPETFPLHQTIKERYRSSLEYRKIHPSNCTDQPFYKPSTGGFNLNAELMQETVCKVSKLDADSRIFTLLAHDRWVLDTVELLPEKVNAWKDRGWAEECRWRFLQDFQNEVTFGDMNV